LTNRGSCAGRSRSSRQEETMGERTSYAPGTFSWAELATNDAEGAKAFYTELFGWNVEDTPVGPDMSYTMARVGGKEAAAMYQQGEREQGGAIFFIWEPRELGGGIIVPPRPLPAGRIAVARDPQGAVFAMWEGELHD
jgi:uncharacterized protein